MNYELAKKLKDAGFPQMVFEYEEKAYKGKYVNHKLPSGFYANAYAPSLEELIEACKPIKADEFWVGTSSNEWEAILNYFGYFDYPEKFKNEEGFAIVELKTVGNTPIEAVANLWLALHT